MNGKHIDSSSNHGQHNAGDGLESEPDVIQKSRTTTPDFSIEGECRFCTVYLVRPLPKINPDVLAALGIRQ